MSRGVGGVSFLVFLSVFMLERRMSVSLSSVVSAADRPPAAAARRRRKNARPARQTRRCPSLSVYRARPPSPPRAAYLHPTSDDDLARLMRQARPKALKTVDDRPWTIARPIRMKTGEDSVAVAAVGVRYSGATKRGGA